MAEQFPEPDLFAIPNLRSPDLDKTTAFYTSYLGFQAERIAPDYLILRRETIELHFSPPDRDNDLPTESTCYIRGAGIDALYDEFKTKDVPGLMPFVHRPWGMYEFYVSDPHGVLLRFGRSDREGDIPEVLK